MKITSLPPPIAVVGDPLLADTRSLLLTLRYANLDFKLVEIDTMIGEHRSKAFLEEMNVEFAKEFGFKVYTDKGSGNPFVADSEGNKVL